MKSQSDISSNETENKGFPEGELFSLSGEDFLRSRKLKAYWNVCYGKVIKLHNKHDDVDEIIQYAFANGKFIPLLVFDNKNRKLTVYDNGELIELDKLISKINSIIHFI